MKVVLQSEGSECGVACLAMIASAYGSSWDLRHLRRELGTSLSGSNLRLLIAQAERLGFASRPLRLDMPALRRLRVPCILHWDLDHFVVLESAGPRRATIADPAVGRRYISYAVVSDHFTGYALELVPTPAFRRAPSRRSITLTRVFGRISGLRRSLAQVLLLATALEILSLGIPLFGQLVIDNVLTVGDRLLLTTMTTAFSILIVTEALLYFARGWRVTALSLDVSRQWLIGLFAHLLRLPVSFFEKRSVGDIVSRFESVNAVQNTLTGNALSALLDGIMASFALAFMIFYSRRLAFFVVLISVVYAVLRGWSFRALRAIQQERLSLKARQQSHFLETLRAIVTLKLANHASDRGIQWQHLLIDVFQRDLRTQTISNWMQAASNMAQEGATVCVFAVGASMVMHGRITVGMLVAFGTYALTFSDRVRTLVNTVSDLSMLRLHAERVAEIALEQPEPIHGRDAVKARQAEPSIEVKDVSFRYSEWEPWVLRNVSLKVEAGESVVIIGPSGCGKTTLLKIMTGLLLPTEGAILYGGIPIGDLGVQAYRDQIAVVLQEDNLLAGSLRENISFFSCDVDDRRIVECARMAAIGGDIERMPMGYDSRVGELGSTLSGGQRQRILLARALYRRPKVLFLDEATSHLDVSSEQQVNAALLRLKLTRVAIAHREETVRNAQRIISLVLPSIQPRASSNTGN